MLHSEYSGPDGPVLSMIDDARYPQDDSFKASKELCELIRPGVAAIFGPTSSFSR